MKTCSNNYIGFQDELCAFKKIRGELYKIKSGADTETAFFMDCEVPAGSTEVHKQVCSGGDQKLSQKVMFLLIRALSRV